jgi:hypothetical protein
VKTCDLLIYLHLVFSHKTSPNILCFKTVLLLYLSLILLNFSDIQNIHHTHRFIITASLHHPIFWLLVRN